MRFKHYSERVQSLAWARFTKACRARAAHRCQMCGDTSRQLQVHHMRYHRIGTVREWFDCVVLCDWCHGSYHERRKIPPTDHGTRYELLVELSKVLMRAGRDPSYFFTFGERENGLWCGKSIIEDGLLDESSRGNTSYKPKQKDDAQRKAAQRKRVSLYWNSKRCG